MVKIFLTLFYVELKGYDSNQNLWNPLAFLLTCFSLLVVSLEPELLTSSIIFSFFWIIFLFIITLNFSRFLRDDYEDGTLDLLRLSPFAFEWLLMIKFLAQWGRLMAPLLLFLSIIIGIIGGNAIETYTPLLLCFGLSSLFLCATTAFISILTLGGKSSAYLGPLLSLPLNIPILIINQIPISLTSKFIYLAGFLSLIFPFFFFAKHWIWGLKNLQDAELHPRVK